MTRTSGTFGAVEQLPSGHYRARYIGPDGRRYKAPTVFPKKDARGWLALRHSEIIRKAWVPPEATPKVTKVTFAVYAKQWMAHRPLKDRTRAHYQTLLDQHLVPAFGPLTVSSITSDDVRAWHTKFGNKTPTTRSHAYGLLRTILAPLPVTGRSTSTRASSGERAAPSGCTRSGQRRCRSWRPSPRRCPSSTRP